MLPPTNKPPDPDHVARSAALSGGHPAPWGPMITVKLEPQATCTGTKRHVRTCVADHMPDVFMLFYHRPPRTGWRRRLFGA